MENPLENPAAAHRPQPIERPVPKRLARMRFLCRLLDNSIELGGGYRIGIDPIIGLLPGVGDFLSATLSLWIIYDAARLGTSKLVIARMAANVLLDSLVGAVPVLGDVFDAAWKSNAMNLRLVEKDYVPGTKERSLGTFLLFFASLVLVLYAIPIVMVYGAFRLMKVILGLE